MLKLWKDVLSITQVEALANFKSDNEFEGCLGPDSDRERNQR